MYETCVIFDLDGTLINTESIVDKAVVNVVTRLKKSSSEREIYDAAEDCRGQRPIDASKKLIEILNLQAVCSADELLSKCSSELAWDSMDFVPEMPGALRAIEHLRKRGVKIALATSTSENELRRKMLKSKISLDMFDAVCCGDHVKHGKPAPDIFLLAMERLHVRSSDMCVVIEDTPAGVTAAKSANMRCIAIPSLRREKFDQYAHADEVLHSLLDVQFEIYGDLPAFDDYVDVSSIDADVDNKFGLKFERFLKLETFLELQGPVIRGFGRGSHMLGIPTANLDVVPLKQVVDQLAVGIYFGFAKLLDKKYKGKIYRTVMSIGFNPFFNDVRKSIEPWLLHDFKGEDFYGETLSVLVVAYLRPECGFTTMDNLVARIRKDAKVCEEAFDSGLVRDLDNYNAWFESF